MLYYDHVGVKTCVLGDSHTRTEEKVMKARKVLNMSSSLGLKKGGLNISTGNLIYWTVIIPILCFGCEIWVIKKKDEDLLAAFQRYAARRLQRFHSRSVNSTSFICLGWMNIVNYVKARKLIFLRTIIVMKEHMPIRRTFINRLDEFIPGSVNMYDSPIMYTLQICFDYGLLENVRNMVNGIVPSKSRWSHLVWEKAWANEHDEWQGIRNTDRFVNLYNYVSMTPEYSIWWQISDDDRSYMKRCEVMVRLLCRSSQLKQDDCRFKRSTIAERMCTLCELAAPEDALHMIMQCPAHTQLRMRLQDEVCDICPDFRTREVFSTILGKPLEGIDEYNMWLIWKITCTYTARMYWFTVKSRIT